MTVAVSDTLSSVDENIVNAAKIIGKSKLRQGIFERVYFGKKHFKTVKEIAKAVGKLEKQVLTEGKRLLDNRLITSKKVERGTAYGKVTFCASHKSRILNFARSPTKVTNASHTVLKSVTNITVKQGGVSIRVKQITDLLP